jgi:hypothetical protein
MNIYRIVFLFIVLILPAKTLLAAECSKPVPQTTVTWNDVLKLSHELGHLICIQANSEGKSEVMNEHSYKEVFDRWSNAVRVASKEMDQTIYGNMTDQKFENTLNIYITHVDKAISPLFGQIDFNTLGSRSGGISLPSISVEESDDPDNIGLLKVKIISDEGKRGPLIVKDVHKGESAERCEQKFAEVEANHCIAYAESWAEAVSSYKIEFTQITAAQVSLAAIRYAKDWENFYSVARSQTLIDTIYTSYKYRKELNKPIFAKAPDKQYFLFRPGVVMEYIEDASDGEQFKEALSFEWYGFNYWRKCPVFFEKACGMSVVSTFSDRASSDEHNFGLMFHYDNNLSLGITRGLNEEKDSGLFVTIDLLKSVESKRERFKAWRSTIKDNLTDFGG